MIHQFINVDSSKVRCLERRMPDHLLVMDHLLGLSMLSVCPSLLNPRISDVHHHTEQKKNSGLGHSQKIVFSTKTGYPAVNSHNQGKSNRCRWCSHSHQAAVRSLSIRPCWRWCGLLLIVLRQDRNLPPTERKERWRFFLRKMIEFHLFFSTCVDVFSLE